MVTVRSRGRSAPLSCPPQPRHVPEITVVVIVYDDADRLPAAMRSVLRQTVPDVELVVVDDASTDGSARVAGRIAAQHPGRVRVVSLEVNSGGCSRPRNVGMTHARGDHVMFLDSDDTLEPDACRLLLERARATGADLVSGRCVRVHFDDNGRESVWCPKLRCPRVGPGEPRYVTSSTVPG